MFARAMGLVLLLTACGNGAAKAEAPDAVQCLAVFEKYKQIAELAGDTAKTRGLHARQLWYAEQARKLPESARSEARLDQLSREAATSGDKDLPIAEACFAQQDRDPAFKTWKPSR